MLASLRQISAGKRRTLVAKQLGFEATALEERRNDGDETPVLRGGRPVNEAATTSFPVPDSPCTNTVVSVRRPERPVAVRAATVVIVDHQAVHRLRSVIAIASRIRPSRRSAQVVGSASLESIARTAFMGEPPSEIDGGRSLADVNVTRVVWSSTRDVCGAIVERDAVRFAPHEKVDGLSRNQCQILQSSTTWPRLASHPMSVATRQIVFCHSAAEGKTTPGRSLIANPQHAISTTAIQDPTATLLTTHGFGEISEWPVFVNWRTSCKTRGREFLENECGRTLGRV